MAKDRGGCLEIASPVASARLALVSLAEHQPAVAAAPALVERARADEPKEADTAGDRPASERARFTKGHLDGLEGLVSTQLIGTLWVDLTRLPRHRRMTGYLRTADRRPIRRYHKAPTRVWWGGAGMLSER